MRLDDDILSRPGALELVEQARRKQEGRRRIARTTRACRIVELRSGDRKAVVHRNTHPPPALPWRVTWFGADGKPWGHDEARTIYKATLMALESGYRIVERIKDATR